MEHYLNLSQRSEDVLTSRKSKNTISGRGEGERTPTFSGHPQTLAASLEWIPVQETGPVTGDNPTAVIIIVQKR